MLKQGEHLPIMSSRTIKVDKDLASPISIAINGIADFTAHKRRFLSRVKTRLEDYQFSTQALQVQPYKRSPNKKYATINSGSRLEMPMSYRSVCKNRLLQSHYESSVRNHINPYMTNRRIVDLDHFIDKMIDKQKSAKLQDRPVKRQVAPSRFLKYELSQIIKMNTSERKHQKTRKPSMNKTLRSPFTTKSKHTSRVQQIDGWVTNDSESNELVF